MKIVERVRIGGRGAGSLFRQAGSSSWFSSFSRNGVEHVESCRTPDLKKAKKIHKSRLDKLASERQGHETFLTPGDKKVTVGQLLDALETDYRLRQVKSLPQCLSHLKRVREYFGVWRAIELSDDAVDTYIQKRVDAGSPPATINREAQLLGQAYTLAMRSKPPRVTTKPNIRRLSEKGNVRKEFFEPAEFAAVVDALPEYLQDMARFAYLTGWRRGDMLGLKWSAVDMERGVIRLFQGETKNDEGRTLAIAGPLAEIMDRRESARLVERKDGEPVVADLVFHHRGRRIVDYRRAWATACKAAGFVYRVVNEKTGRRELGRRMHDLRRTAARDRVDDGTPERVVMAMTGHKTRAMFDRYSIASTKDIEAALLRAALPAEKPGSSERNPVETR
jgi:integrase